MKRVIFGIFAHPDDEAFMVSPTLIKEVADGADVHLITLTSGQHGTNPDNEQNLGEVRLKEWKKGASLMGARSTHALGLTDGSLSNDHIDHIVAEVTAIVSTLLAKEPDSLIELMSFDFNGLTGHIDHIVATRAVCLAFYRLKTIHPDHFSRIRLCCLSASHHPHIDTTWRYMDAGRDDESIDETIDARAHRGRIIEVIKAHHSQRHDGEAHIARYGAELGINHFIILE
jgi:LmbE family N-acetylglucosaminyl deacetylase